ncbi:hypothetical protein [Streptomyces sp. NPDC003393]
MTVQPVPHQHDRQWGWSISWLAAPRCRPSQHGIAHLKDWRVLSPCFGCCDRTGGTTQAVAGLLSYQRTLDLVQARRSARALVDPFARVRRNLP